MVLTEKKLNEIVKEIKECKCIPFLGSAASITSNGYNGPPIGSQLAEELANECCYPGHDKKNLPKVAQFYEHKKGRKELYNKLFEKINPFTEPSPLQILIAKIYSNFEIIITTNYDKLMENALVKAKINCIPYIHDPTASNPISFTPPDTILGPVLYKMHGSIDKESSIVITEDDFIDFLTKLKPNDQGIPSNIPFYFMRYLTTCRLLFIGYGLEDLNFKVLFKGAVERLPKYERRVSYAIQKRSSNHSDDYWEFLEKYWLSKGIEIFDIDVYEFADQLNNKL